MFKIISIYLHINAIHCPRAVWRVETNRGNLYILITNGTKSRNIVDKLNEAYKEEYGEELC